MAPDDKHTQRDKGNDDDRRVVFLAKDTPAEFLPQLYALAAGDFAAVGLTGREPTRRMNEVDGPTIRPHLAKRTKF